MEGEVLPDGTRTLQINKGMYYESKLKKPQKPRN